MSFKASAKHLFGLEKLDDRILDRMNMDNMSLARVVSPVVLIGALAVFFACITLMPASLMSSENYLPLAIITALLAVACTLLLAVSTLYCRGSITGRKTTHRALGFFIIAGYIYAIALAVMAYISFGRMSVFYIFVIVSGVLFVFNPIVQISTTIVAVTCFYITFYFLKLGDAMMVVSCSCVTLAILAASVLRYNELRDTVLAAINSEDASRTDVLTQLENRLAFDIEYPTFENHALVVAMTDIDDFKYFNDAYSHETGDEVLQEFSAALKASFPQAHIYRYGGDEFVIVETDIDSPDSFAQETQRFLQETEAIRLEDGEHERVTASLGYGYGHPSDQTALNGLLHLADRKLYEAKRGGKRRCIGAPLGQSDISREISLPGALPLRRSYETDQLTGLPNMQFFRSHSMQFALHLETAGNDPVLIYFNIVNFKLVNERWGYNAGDDLLCETADAIQESFPNMLLSLIGEDHFALICPRDGLENRVERAQAIFDTCKRESAVILKAGVCQISSSADDIGTAYDSAKVACDSIKMSYSKDLRFYDDELDRDVRRRRYVLDNIHDAIVSGKITVHYQPVYRSMTGKLCGSEALVRWEDDRYGIIPPSDFIGLLEDTQQIGELDAHVVARVCDDWKEMHDAGETVVPVSVNFSRADFQLLDVASIVEKNVKRVEMPRQMIHIEVTESAFSEVDEALSAQINQLRSLGYEVWMDDFGSGYSSLNQLRWHDFDLVKIDMAFLRHFDDEQTRSLIISIVDLIKRMGAQTLVEGVETAAQYEFMRNAGCELMQGFYLSRPLERSSFRTLLKREARNVEPYPMRGYYNAIGRVNLLSQAPFSFNGNHVSLAEISQESMPLAIIERKGEQTEYLMESAAFREQLEHLEVDERLRALSGRPGVEQSKLRQHFDAFLDAVAQEDKVVSSDFTIKGHDCLVRGRKIASYGEADAMLITFEDRTHGSEYTMEDQIEIALAYVNSLFDEVDVLDLASQLVRTAYDQSEESKNISNEARPIRQYASERARTVVYPEDRKRYLQLLDMNTIEERFANTSHGYLGGIIRMLSADGTYRWKTLMLIPAQTKTGNYVVVCKRDTNLSMIEAFDQGDENVSDDLLWSAASKLLPEKVFWKDRDLRFLGANREFLDYFGFDSVKEIVGRTDEEIGWRLDDDTLQKSERAAIEQNRPIIDRPGTCIVRGMTRRITTNVVPLVRDEKVFGIIGYFTDTGQDRHEPAGMRAPEGIDEQTGTLDCLGLLNALTELEEEMASGGPDYGLVYLDLDNLREINAEYGRSFGDRVLARVALTLVEHLGTGEIVGHMRADEFVLAQQLPQGSAEDRIESLEKLAVRAKESISSISLVDATPCHTTASVGCSLRSECENATGVIELAEQRMRDDRSLESARAEVGGEPPLLRMTRSDAARRLRVLSEHFDFVRIVDPSTCEAYVLDPSGRNVVKSPARCFAAWGKASRCANCISARALADHAHHAKRETVETELVRITSRYLEIDGAPYALETGTFLGPHSHGDSGVETREPGIYQHEYLRKTLSHLQARQISCIETRPQGPTRDIEDFYQKTAKCIRESLRPKDLVVHTEHETFVVIFDAGSPLVDLEGTLESVRSRLAEIPAIAYIGAAEGQDTVAKLALKARSALFQARREPSGDQTGAIVFYSTSSDRTDRDQA